MISLPAELAALADAASDASGRRGLMGVRVYDYDDDRWRADASDGYIAVIVQGEGSAPLYTTEASEAMDVKRVYVIPTENWRAAFRMVPQRTDKPMRFVNFVADDDAIMAFHFQQTQHFGHLDGRFPDVLAVLPKTPPVVRFRLHISNVLRLLSIAKKVLGENGIVTFQWYGPDEPLGVLGNANGMTFDAVTVPIDTKVPDPTLAPEPPATQEPLAASESCPPVEGVCDLCQETKNVTPLVYSNSDGPRIGSVCQDCAPPMWDALEAAEAKLRAHGLAAVSYTLGDMQELFAGRWPAGWPKLPEEKPRDEEKPADEEDHPAKLVCDCCRLEAEELEPVNDCDAKAIGWFCESCARTIETCVHEVALKFQRAKAIIPPLTLADVCALLNDEWPEGWKKIEADPPPAPQEEKKPSLADAPDYDVWQEHRRKPRRKKSGTIAESGKGKARGRRKTASGGDGGG